jgi:hypothetical protein
MTHLLLTLLASFVINLAVLAALKVGLENGRRTGADRWAGQQPCI